MSSHASHDVSLKRTAALALGAEARRETMDFNASDLLPVSRDFAFVVDDAVEADKLVKAAKGADKALIADVTVFDQFKLEGGKKSLAIDVTLQPRDTTLTDKDIEAVSSKIVAMVTKATGGTLRG